MSHVAYDSRAITVDGKRMLLLSGAIHYPRSTPEMWPELLARSKAAGLNCVETYVFWNLHERRRGVFDFSGRLDLLRFCREVEAAGLKLILRIGPYICAETNYGGFPPWLRDIPGLQTRTFNQAFMNEMGRWVRQLTDYVRPMFAPNGGPIVLVQLENEYNNVAVNYGAEGQRYLQWCVQLGESLSFGVPQIMCVGAAEGALETINQYLGHEGIPDHFKKHAGQPALWTEAYPGWYNNWGYAYRARRPEQLGYAVARFFAAGGTGINYYMWHGGTNFGRESMYLQTTSYDFDAPLDEYSLPTTKSQQLTKIHHFLQDHSDLLLSSERPKAIALGEQQCAFKYGAIAFVCNDAKHAATVRYDGKNVELAAQSVLLLEAGKVVLNTAEIAPSQRITRKMSPVRGNAGLNHFATWQEPLPLAADAAPKWTVSSPQPIEQLKLTRDESDYCWYATELNVTQAQAGKGTLSINGCGDVLHVFVEDKFAATTPTPLQENRLLRDNAAFTQNFALQLAPGKHRIAILCCALGMIKGDWMLGLLDGERFVDMQNMSQERKGIWGTMSWNGQAVRGPWTMQPGLVGERSGLFGDAAELVRWKPIKAADRVRPLTWLRALFKLGRTDAPLALDLTGLNKGLAWLNGNCIGRYWLVEGVKLEPSYWNGNLYCADIGQPTQRYYHLPKAWLKDENELVLFEELGGELGALRICARA